MEARQEVVKEAEGPMTLAESKAALMPYGTGGGRAAGCGDCVKEKAEAARRAAGLVKTGEAARLAGDAIDKVGFAKHASEAESREKAASAEAFE